MNKNILTRHATPALAIFGLLAFGGAQVASALPQQGVSNIAKGASQNNPPNNGGDNHGSPSPAPSNPGGNKQPAPKPTNPPKAQTPKKVDNNKPKHNGGADYKGPSAHPAPVPGKGKHDDPRGHYHQPKIFHPGYDIGHRMHHLPPHYRRIRIGPRVYFYADGLFFNYDPFGYYTVIAPPIGAVVYALPYGYSILTINGIYYYRWGSAYYIYNGMGYQVVPPPTTTTVVVNNTATYSVDDDDDDTVDDDALNQVGVVSDDNATGSTDSALLPLESLPADYKSVYVDGKVYYHVNGCYYQWDENRQLYLVVPSPLD